MFKWFRGCDHDWNYSRHPVTLEITKRFCTICFRHENKTSKWCDVRLEKPVDPRTTGTYTPKPWK